MNDDRCEHSGVSLSGSGNRTIFERALAVWGQEEQLNMLLEECGELIVKTNHLRRGRCDVMAFAEEVADVQILCQQMEHLVGPEMMAAVREKKIKRLARRLDEAEENIKKDIRREA